jgi:hypothetical protein
MRTTWNHVKTSSRWILLVLAGAVASACGAQIEPSTSTETAEVASCCFDGLYVCPSNPAIAFDYAPPGCGDQTKPAAQLSCKTACGQACTDRGWRPSGLCD